MEGIIGSLNKDKWQEVPVANKPADFIEFHINRNHKKIDPTTFAFMVETDNIDPKPVLLEYANDDPIKNVGVCELKLNADGTKIVGMDLDGDVVVLK